EPASRRMVSNVSLPDGVADQTLYLPGVRPRPSRRTTPCSMGTRVLVVDDNSDSAETLCEALELFGGYQSRYALTGKSAIEEARVWRPEVVLLDLGLPALDGLGVGWRLIAW